MTGWVQSQLTIASDTALRNASHAPSRLISSRLGVKFRKPGSPMTTGTVNTFECMVYEGA